ncbi:MAG: putative AMP-dependent synthetase/ligase [Acidimicrobiales bacterium]|jgi:long-chain acyl-CoA synthetase|nr:putative AMP-dependent synthetase/ligase [Acidimicrobiales bacterium]
MITAMGAMDRIRMLIGDEPTLGRLLERLASIHGDDPLVEEAGDRGLRLSYREGAERVDRMAAGIAAKIEPGDRVVLNVPNGYDLFLLCQAACRAGGVAVPVNDKMRAAEIEHVVDDSGAALVITDSADVLADEGLGDERAMTAHADDVAGIFYTSGTTGLPKGARLTHQALVGTSARMAALPVRLAREAVTGMPVAHIAGFTILVAAMCGGVPVYLLRAFRPTDALDAIESRRATAFVGVPTMYRMMDEAGAADRDLRSIRMWASGADAMPDDLVKKFQRMGATVTLPLVGVDLGEAIFVDGYGMVELAGGVATRVSLPRVTLPLMPLPGNSMKAVDEAGNEVGVGEVGELVVKSRGALKGYHGNDQASHEVLTEEGWVRTGDLARRGPFGLMTLAGRMKHVIKHGGYSVFAVEVETQLARHPDVAEAAVIGLPDDRKGEVPAAVVRLRPGASLTEDALIAWAKEQMADYKVPTRVAFVDELPRTGTDKIQKDALPDLFD